MAKITVQQISRRAKKIRRNGEPWTDAIKRASKQLKSGTVGSSGRSSKPGKKRKSVPRKKKSVTSYKPRKKTHQTGTSSKSRDRMIKAKPPGKRIVKGGNGKKHAYYEYRKNRSDMPGQLTGVSPIAMNQMLLSRIKDNSNKQGMVEREIQRLQELKRKNLTKTGKRACQNAIDQKKRIIAALRKDTSMLKSLIK